MKVFISWSGDRSLAVARALSEFLPRILQSVQPYLSADMTEKGQNWTLDIESAIQSADTAILCLTPENLGSPWLLYEAGALSARQVSLYPLLVGLSPVDVSGPLGQFQFLTTSREDIQRLLTLLNKSLPRSLPSSVLTTNFDAFWPRLEARFAEVSRLTPEAPEEIVDLVRSFNITQTSLPTDRVSIARLPTSGPDLFGREGELQLLDKAWENPEVNIITFVAWGGVGKTALVNHWLKQRMARDDYRGAERVYGWSFYSQGTSDRAASADLFIDQALRWFGDSDAPAGSPWDKGERLAHLIRQTRTLLVLDGLEPLQHPPGAHEGRLKDAALQALVIELAGQQPGLCVITTRERIGDLVEFESGTVIQHDLEHLSSQAGAELLRAQQVKGDEEELEKAAMEYQGHALSLTLLGSYLADVYGGDIRRRDEIGNLEEDIRYGGRAEQVMRAYEEVFGEGMELAILRLLSLFDRPADMASIAALREPPVIAGLTEPLQHFKGREWNQAVAKLRRLKLLGEPEPNEPATLDTHPLVRQHFEQQLKRDKPDAWQEAHHRLFEHLKRTTREFPNTIEEMSPLFAAVLHGCAGGRYQEALTQVYLARIQRWDQRFSSRKLGAFAAELSALSGFFEIPWEQPVTKLAATQRAFVLNEAGFHLLALGRLQEAAQSMQVGLEIDIAKEDWKGAAIATTNLSDVYLTIGDLAKALTLAKESAELADRSGDEVEQTTKRTSLADVLHRTGRIDEAIAAFRSAEELQRRLEPSHPFLYGLSGFKYCALLLDLGKIQEVKERATQTLEIAKLNNWLLDIALDNLSLGRAWLLGAQQIDTRDATTAPEFLQNAVDGLRRAGQLDYLPRGLLARAEMYRKNRDFNDAARDLAEVLRIATRSGMGLYLADYHLESSRLRLAQGDKEGAREHCAAAREMIDRMGYHRRDKEVQELQEQLVG